MQAHNSRKAQTTVDTTSDVMYKCFMQIGVTRIGTETDLPELVLCIQIGMSRIGVRSIARNSKGRFVNIRKVTPVAEPEFVQVTKMHKSVGALRLVTIAAILVVSGWIRNTMAFALAILNIAKQHVVAAILHLLQKEWVSVHDNFSLRQAGRVCV